MKTIKAKEGHYLTQVALEDENQRIFVRELSGMKIADTDWRDASEEEKNQWHAARESEMPIE